MRRALVDVGGELVAGGDPVDVHEDTILAEPASQTVVEPARVPRGVVTPITDEDPGAGYVASRPLSDGRAPPGSTMRCASPFSYRPDGGASEADRTADCACPARRLRSSRLLPAARRKDGSMDADLVLEGGGVKGIGLAGAYSALCDADYTFHRIAGSSAGAIVGALIAAGMEPKELETVMRTVDYGRFQDEGFIDHLGHVGKGLSVLFEKGIYEGRYLHVWLDGLLTGLGKRTFGDLRIDDKDSSLPPERAYRLVVMTSDVTRGVLVRLPWDYPRYGLKPDDQLVADAVRASMSIPFFFEPVRFKGRDDAGKEVRSYMVDGGMLSNFPIEVFDRTDGERPRWPTFGIKLSAKPTAPVIQRFEVKGALGLARAMVGTMTGFHDQMHIDDPTVLARTMFIDTGTVRATDFDLDEPTQNLLFDSGRRGTEKFLDGWNFDTYVTEFRGGDPRGDEP